MVAYLILLLSVLCIGYLQADGEINVQIADGKIKGRSRVTINNVTFYSFQGIPYAQPPINELRFKAPVPVQPWDGVLDATREGNICYQVTNDSDNESEDCLFINVFTPVEPSSESALPVMFFIYGGGFIYGSSEELYYGPDHLMEYGVILVTFNYRVGPFGFFSTGDDAIPGNAGLKDQNLALQWVQKNIASFGGDPDKVTIFGESAGSASVGYQILSPLSAGLFKGAIGESGSPLSAWACQRDQVKITYQTASYIKNEAANASSGELLEYLLGLPAKDIDAASHTMASTESADYQQILQGFFYAPVIEHEHDGAFLTERMFELLRKGDFNKVPLLIGFNSGESYFFVNSDNVNHIAKSFDENNELLLPLDMHITSDKKAQAAKVLKEFYVGDSTFSENQVQLVKYFSDQSFIRSIIKHATLQSAFTDVYFYRFAYSGILGGNTNESAKGFSENVRHGEDLFYIFRRNYGGVDNTDLTKFPEQDQIVFKRFITLFTNFAKTLNPTPQPDDILEDLTKFLEQDNKVFKKFITLFANFAKTLNPTPQPDDLLEDIIWPKVTLIDFAYLDIGSSSEIKYHPREPNYHEWEVFFYRFGIPPYDTY